MSLDNFIHIIGGKLLNSPNISSFNSIEKDPKHINQGDLFIAYKKEDIEEAIQKGAYTILCDYDIKITDDEIAWIFVNNLKTAIMKLIRYTLLKTDIAFFYLDNIEFEIAKSITKDERIHLLSDDLFKEYKELINSRYKIEFVFSDDRSLLENIYPNYQTVDDIDTKIKTISKTIFTTTFVYKERFFEQISIASIFLSNLNKILNFFDDYSIMYDLYRLKLDSHFCPIFLSKTLKPSKFGKTQRVLICEEDKTLLDMEIKYLKDEAPWANTVAIESKIDNSLIQRLNSDLKPYHFILINESCSSLLEYLQSNTKKQVRNLFEHL